MRRETALRRETATSLRCSRSECRTPALRPLPDHCGTDSVTSHHWSGLDCDENDNSIIRQDDKEFGAKSHCSPQLDIFQIKKCPKFGFIRIFGEGIRVPPLKSGAVNQRGSPKVRETPNSRSLWVISRSLWVIMRKVCSKQ